MCNRRDCTVVIVVSIAATQITRESRQSLALLCRLRGAQVPFMLLVQAVAFWMPSVLWTMFAARTSIPLNSLIKSAREAVLCDTEQRTRIINYMARCLIDVLLHSAKRGRASRQMGGTQNSSGGGSKMASKPTSSRGCSSCCAGGIGCFLILAYLLCKLVMIAHALGEVYFIQRFTQTNYTCAPPASLSSPVLLSSLTHHALVHREIRCAYVQLLRLPAAARRDGQQAVAAVGRVPARHLVRLRDSHCRRKAALLHHVRYAQSRDAYRARARTRSCWPTEQLCMCARALCVQCSRRTCSTRRSTCAPCVPCARCSLCCLCSPRALAHCHCL